MLHEIGGILICLLIIVAFTVLYTLIAVKIFPSILKVIPIAGYFFMFGGIFVTALITYRIEQVVSRIWWR